jgi:hypothetical protein
LDLLLIKKKARVELRLKNKSLFLFPFGSKVIKKTIPCQMAGDFLFHNLNKTVCVAKRMDAEITPFFGIWRGFY